MIKSMTGFGKAEHLCGLKKLQVEIKSLNSKQADVSVKLPQAFREREMEVRQEVTQSLIRGKIDVYISVESEQNGSMTELQADLAVAYHGKIKELAEVLGVPVPQDVLSVILRMPDVFRSQTIQEQPCAWEEVMDCVREALSHADSFRMQEGLALAKDLSERVRLILQGLKEVEARESYRTESVRERIRQHLEDAVAVVSVDQNRFEQELIYYLEKMDITEEKVRLANHCAFFLETLESGEPVGRKLGFISQEMGREINTLGSKSNDAVMQQVVVRMKDELEKLKEQLLNIL